MSTRLWLLLAFITPSLCRQRRWIKGYPFNHLQLGLCWPCLSGSCKRDRDIAQVRERLGRLQLQAVLGQGKEQALNKVLLLPQPGLLSGSCTHLESLRAAAAALDRAAHLLSWDSQAPQVARQTSQHAGMHKCPGRDAEPTESWLTSPSPSVMAEALSCLLSPLQHPHPVPLPPSPAQVPAHPPQPSPPCSQGSPAHLQDCTPWERGHASFLRPKPRHGSAIKADLRAHAVVRAQPPFSDT